MSRTAWEPIESARLLRTLAAELLLSEGPTRNGLFLELHRLHDVIFRMALERHPDAPPELAAQAFAVVDALPAPQVVRELHGLGAALITPEIRSLYKHMNVARNNLAHEAVVGRVTVSKGNVKRMANLATLLATQLDPDEQGLPLVEAEERSPVRTGGREVGKLAYGVVGLLTGVGLTWTILDAPSGLASAVAGGTLVLGLGSFLFFARKTDRP
ncbi:MAG: hypothetical protein H0T73_17165 [Ardenticatenales bacterium]|nr:hypothetical protein [Ardenticatenales bacterium]